MTQGTFGGKRTRHKAGMRRASVQDMQQGRHRIGIFAALGAVAVGALVLAGAVTGTLWPGAGIETAQAEPDGADAVQPPTTQKVASVAETASQTAEQPVQTAQLLEDAVPAKVETASVASGKSSSLSPDERIDRAIDRITSGSTNETLKKAITVAVQEKADEPDSTGDTVTTASVASVPEKSAYARASAGRGDVAALSAIRNVDKSEKPTAIEPAAVEDSKPAPAAAAAPTGPAGPATVSTAVRLRAGMTNNSAVVATVPAGAQVQASQTCQNWCEVTYDGHHGYIYKSFIRRSAEEDAASTPAAEQAKTVAASETGADTGILAQTGSAKELAEAAERAQQRSR